MSKRMIDWAPGVAVLDGRSVPPRCACDWGNGHRCKLIADHRDKHQCACQPSWGHNPPPPIDHNDEVA